MKFHGEKLVRFQDGRSEKSFNKQSPSNCGPRLARLRSTVYSISMKFQRRLEFGSERIRSFTGSFRSFSLGKFVTDDEGTRNRILDPQGSFLQKWNKIFVLSCAVAVSLDPLFFYIPIIDDEMECLDLDPKLEVAASILRSFTDIFYLIHIIFQFCTGFVAPSSRVFGRGVLVQDSSAIAKSYLSSYFIIDILAVLPLPQVLGAFWYLLSIERETTCWEKACGDQSTCRDSSFYWYLFSIERETTCWERACGDQSTCRNSSFYCEADHTGFDF